MKTTMMVLLAMYISTTFPNFSFCSPESSYCPTLAKAKECECPHVIKPGPAVDPPIQERNSFECPCCKCPHCRVIQKRSRTIRPLQSTRFFRGESSNVVPTPDGRGCTECEGVPK
jgi:hypothetical protein